MTTNPPAVEEALRIANLATQAGITLRFLGGAAIRLRCPDPSPSFERETLDLDCVVARSAGHRLRRFFEGAGYQSDVRFNALYGHDRMRFTAGDLSIDVFVGGFRMSHSLDLEARLEIDDVTVSVADLALTKLQTVELNEKDITDTYMLLDNFDVSDDDDGLNGRRMALACAHDWGLWRTVTANLETCGELLPRYPLEPDRAARIASRLDSLRYLIETAPKSVAWKLRARIGERKRWYAVVQEAAS